jgi:predicted kinase
MTIYIQHKAGKDLETIDEMDVKTREDRKELRRLLTEYRMAMPYATIYSSRRACKAWKRN